jgi:hypothetical protein
LLVWIGVFLVAAVLLIVYAAEQLQDDNASRPEVLLPIVVITGVVALMATLAVAAALYGLFNLSDRNQALGLPAGSAQAVIALSLILIFAVVALYASSSTGPERFQSVGLSQGEFESIPPGEVVSSKRTVENGTPTYEVVRSVESQDRKDLNTQLLTTVSTLVVAVAGFYFGSKSVQEGSRAAIEAAAPNRSLSVTAPPSPYSMTSSEPLAIRVASEPQGAALSWTLEDDSKGKLLRKENGEFVYEPGGEMIGTDKSASLTFKHVEDPNTVASLIVKFPTPPEAPVESVADEPPEGGGAPPTTTEQNIARARKVAGEKGPLVIPPRPPESDPEPGDEDTEA